MNKKAPARTKKKTARPAKKMESDAGTPTIIMTTLLIATPVFTLLVMRQIAAGSLSITSLVSMGALLILGLSTAFFWRRIPKTPFKTLAGYSFVLVFWCSVGLQLIDGFLVGEAYHLLEHTLIFSVAAIGALLMVAWVTTVSARFSSVATIGAGALSAAVAIFQYQNNGIDMSPQGMDLLAKKLVPAAGPTDFEEVIKADTGEREELKLPGQDSSAVGRSLDATKAVNVEKPADPLLTDNVNNTSLTPQNEIAPPSINKVKPKAVRKRPSLKKAKSTAKSMRETKTKRRIHWSYQGRRGPRYWANLSSDYKLCQRGREQSPIDIPTTWDFESYAKLFSRPTPFSVKDTGHRIKVSLTRSPQTYFNDSPYQLDKMYFHSPSEHTYNGKAFPMEIQFIHRSKNNSIAVMGGLVIEGKPNKELDKIIKYFPNRPLIDNPSLSESIDPKQILPNNLDSFHYLGSLTTPPCSENVKWYILNNPIEMSKEQIAAFKGKYRSNARPTQPLNHRR
ncbi:MAG: carbonic anhydrase family protein [Pseudobacteriovorax sp.]|nr:carbonic anhydrase family protein [Pseudobacteriovorax sp.]